MKIALIDGSPKPQQSTSAYLLSALEEKLKGHACEWFKPAKSSSGGDFAALAGCDALAIAFPLYVDGLPSSLLGYLAELAPLLREHGAQPRIYAIINNGFYEPGQSEPALAQMKLWCERAGCRWGQGLLAGAGAMAQTGGLSGGPNAPLGNALDALAASIAQGNGAEDLRCTPSFPRGLYKAMAHMGMRGEARRNGVLRTVRSRPF